jgi:hypothetical protein
MFLFQKALCVGIMASCVAGTSTPAAAQFEVRSKRYLPGNPLASGTVSGDFNRDGRPDVAILDGGLFVLLGNGNGTFQSPVNYSTSLSYALAVGDFNQDGILDIVVANLVPSTVSVYLGNGDGTFQTPKTSVTNAGSYFVAVGDFNGDHKADLVVIDPPYVSVLLGNGDGTFQAPNDYSTFVGAHELAVGDFNNDHRLDVAVVGYNGGTSDMGIFLGNGDGTLQTPIINPLNYTPGSVVAADFNRDGKLDLAIGKYLGDRVGVLLGNGNATFAFGSTYLMTAEPNQIIAIDLNGDGKVDLAIPNGQPAGATVLWGMGDGTFQPPQLFQSMAAGPMTAGDFNLDGKPDLVLANGTLGAITLLNTGVVSFSPTAPLIFPLQVVNTTSAPGTVTLTNNGATVLAISAMKVSGDFEATSGCGTTVLVGATCSIEVVFKPKSAGARSGTITLYDSASSKPQVVTLSGTATALVLSPKDLNFGSQSVGTKSLPLQIAVTDASSSSVTIKSIQIGGNDNSDFSQTNDCGSQVVAGAGCTITLIFSPQKTGSRSANVDVVIMDGASPTPVALVGTGT